MNAVSSFKSKASNQPKIALLIHVFYVDLIEEIISYGHNIPNDFDLIITCTANVYFEAYSKFNEAFPNSLIDIKIVPNKGRDIGPFLCNHVDTYLRYDYICKIHSKKSLHAGGIGEWRNFLYDRLLGSKEQVANIIERFEQDPKLGVQYPEYSEDIKPFISWGSNKESCHQLSKKLNLSLDEELKNFPAGSMFWFRCEAFKELFNMEWTLNDFPEEDGQVDGTIMHAIERLLLIIAEAKGFSSRSLDLDV